MQYRRHVRMSSSLAVCVETQGQQDGVGKLQPNSTFPGLQQTLDFDPGHHSLLSFSWSYFVHIRNQATHYQNFSFSFPSFHFPLSPFSYSPLSPPLFWDRVSCIQGGCYSLCSWGWPWTSDFLLLPPECWDFRHAPPCLVFNVGLEVKPRPMCMLGKYSTDQSVAAAQEFLLKQWDLVSKSQRVLPGGRSEGVIFLTWIHLRYPHPEGFLDSFFG